MTTEAGSPAPLWRDPAQERSRVRVARMLETAKELLAEHGLEGLTMEAVARGAGVPIGSLYQFFPDRNALLARLFTRFLESTDELVADRLRAVDSIATLAAAAEGLAESLYNAMANDPAHAEIWSAVRATRALRHLDVEDSHRMAGVWFAAARPLAPDSVDDTRLTRVCFLVCDLLGAVTQTALEQGGREGELLVREFAAMANGYFRSVLRG